MGLYCLLTANKSSKNEIEILNTPDTPKMKMDSNKGYNRHQWVKREMRRIHYSAHILASEALPLRKRSYSICSDFIG